LAYNTKAIKTDVDKKPIPQYYNPTLDQYEALLGENGATRHILYGPDGNPISTDDSNKLAVRASEIETILNEIKSKDFATQTTLAAILAKIIAAPATEAKQDALAALIGEVDADPTANTLLARLKSLEDKIDAITDGTSPAVTQLSGSKMEVYGTSLDDRPDATTVPIGATFTIVDASQEFRSWISDGTNWVEV